MGLEVKIYDTPAGGIRASQGTFSGLILRLEMILETSNAFTGLKENWGKFSGRFSLMFLILG